MDAPESLEAPIIESAFVLHQLVLQRSDDVLAAWNAVCVAFSPTLIFTLIRMTQCEDVIF